MPTDQDKVIRKLRAILSADVKGYSLLMANNEAFTIKTIKAYRNIMSDLIQQHNGRVVDSPGDNILADFASVVDAVTCATEIQKVLKVKNEELPDEKRLEFRIGVNIGDVVQDGDRIYGNGVNVAARIESLAEPGGVSISRNAYGQIKDKLTFGYEYIGEHEVKNIKDPIRVYKVLMDSEDAGKLVGDKPRRPRKKWFLPVAVVAAIIVTSIAWHLVQISSKPDVEPVSIENMAFSLPEKPSIAVLPFNNLSGDSNQSYIADGISENIISDLSKISEMFVIASNSTFTYKGKPVKVQQVSEELGVRYVLQGSTHKIGDRLRITTQLIDATTGHYLWSEKYDRNMKNFFALQDEITHRVVVELQVKLTEGEQARISHQSTTNLEAWSYAVRGLKLFERASKENNVKAMEFFEQAVELDPGYVWAWVRLAWTHVVAGRPGWSQSPSESLKKAFEISEKILVMDESDSDVRALAGLACLLQNQYEQAISEGERSIKLGPTNAQAHVLLAVTMHNVGRFNDAIELVKKAMRLHPYYPAYYLQWLGGAYRMTGHYDDAINVYKQLLERSIKGEFPITGAHLFLADVYAESGREDESWIHIAEVLKLKPNFSIKDINKIRTYRFKDPAHLERRLNALRKAGLPEHPPLELPDKPSIAVLPFNNMSGDPKQEYFSDGITEEIITGLSKVPDLFVIARNSVFVYKGEHIDIKRVARELGVRYVLEGSVRKAEDMVRITAQLIDANTEGHVWSERYDRELKDIFKLQDDITKNIMEALQIKLTVGEEARLHAKGTDNLDAYMKYLHGRNLLTKLNKENNARGRQLLEEAIQIDPNYSPAYESLSESYFLDILFGTSKSSEKSMMTSIKYCKKAITLDETSSVAHAWLGFLYANIGKYDEGISLCERGIELGPSDEGAYRYLSLALRYAGRWEEAIKASKTAIRLNPFPEGGTLYGLGVAYAFTGQFEKAIEACRKATAKNPNDLLSHVVLAAVYAMADQTAEAKVTSTDVKRIEPNFSAVQFVKRVKYKRKEDIEIFLKSLQKAGL